MKPILAAVLILFIASCNTSGDKTTGEGTDSLGITTVTPGSLVAMRIDSASLPPYLRFRGNVVEAWQWKDKLGDNILITTIVPPYPVKSEEEGEVMVNTAELHAFHYLKKDSAYKLLWKISDAEKECGFDITTGFIKDATTITDLDNNGIAETVVQYKMACRSDVSPAYMKLIMHQDTAKYTLRGSMWIRDSEKAVFTVTENDANAEKLKPKKDEYEDAVQRFGRYHDEKDFARAPAGFLEYARRQWVKHANETFEPIEE